METEELHPKALGVRRYPGSRYVEETSSGVLSITRVLRWESDRTWESDVSSLPRVAPRPSVWCPFCGRRGRYAHTDRFKYFSHADGEQDCTESDLETLRHRRGKEILVAGLKRAREERRAVMWSLLCACGTLETRELIRAETWDTESDEVRIGPPSLDSSYRVDVGATQAGKPIAAFEVRVRHPTEFGKLSSFEQGSIPLVEFPAASLIGADGQGRWDGTGPLPPASVWRVPGTSSPFQCAKCVAQERARALDCFGRLRLFVQALRVNGLDADRLCVRCNLARPFRLLEHGQWSAKKLSDAPPTIEVWNASGRRLVVVVASAVEAVPRACFAVLMSEPQLAEFTANLPSTLPFECVVREEREPDSCPRICASCKTVSSSALDLDRIWLAVPAKHALRPPLTSAVERRTGAPKGSLTEIAAPFGALVDEHPEQAWAVPALRPLVPKGLRGLPLGTALIGEVVGEPRVAQLWNDVSDLLAAPHRLLAAALSAGERVPREDLLIADRLAIALSPGSPDYEAWRGRAWVAEALGDHAWSGSTAWHAGRVRLARRVYRRIKDAYGSARVFLPKTTELWVNDAIQAGEIVPIEVVPNELLTIRAHAERAKRLSAAILLGAKVRLPFNGPIHSSIELDPAQREAVLCALSSTLSVIAGGAGTGKTTIIRAILDSTPNQRWLLCAPTGKAVQRMRQAVSECSNVIDVRTVASVLSNSEPLRGAFGLVLDEAGFLDLDSADRTFKLIVDLKSAGPSCVVLVGDPHQLPSIGPGAVLRDMLEARVDGKRVVPHVSLRTGHRSESSIGRFAGGVLQGRVLVGESVQFIEVHDASVTDYLLPLVELHGADLQIIAPRNNTVRDINRAVQRLLNPDGEPMGRSIRAGDRVICTRNRYDFPSVLNGEIGTLTRGAQAGFWIQFGEGQRGPFDLEQLELFELAYAITIHKSQGSEWSSVAVVLPEAGSALDRSMLYTAATRAKRRLYLLGSMEALQKAVARTRRRETLLRPLLEHR